MHTFVRMSIQTVSLLLALVSATAAGTPQAFQVQGILRDGSGNLVADDSYNMLITGWDNSTGGNLLWTENKTAQTSDGLFQVVLDGAGPAGLLVKSGQQYLQVQVSGEAPLLPRIRLASVPSALLSTRMDGDITTEPGALKLNPIGDPDFDLLKMAAVDSTASLAMGGDPDFDLLRIAAGPSGSSLVMLGDPDFDLLRITAVDSTASLSIGDPDFDLLRMTATPSGSSLVMLGDPDFDLLRITGVDSTASLSIGDPDFDLLRMTASPSGGSIAIKDGGVQVVRIQSGGGGGGGGSYAIGEEGVQIIRAVADSGSGSIAVEEQGIQRILMESSGGGAQCDFYETWACGAGNVEIGSDGMTFRCTPGGLSPDTTVSIDRDGNMRLDGNLAVGGNICAVGTIGACSDERYKKEITTLKGALASLGQIRGVNFNWRTEDFPDKHFRTDCDLGFIAQELKEVVPQVVTLGKDGFYSVDYGRLTPLLVEAVKELDLRSQRIDELEARLASVEKVQQAELVALTDRLVQLEKELTKLASGSSPEQPDVTLADAK